MTPSQEGMSMSEGGFSLPCASPWYLEPAGLVGLPVGSGGIQPLLWSAAHSQVMHIGSL